MPRRKRRRMPPRKRHRNRSPVNSPPRTADVKSAFAWVPFCMTRLAFALGQSDNTDTHTSMARTVVCIYRDAMFCKLFALTNTRFRFRRKWKSMTLSSAFSGVGTPELAAHFISMWFIFVLSSMGSSLGIDPELPLLFCVEMDVWCREVLLASQCIRRITCVIP